MSARPSAAPFGGRAGAADADSDVDWEDEMLRKVHIVHISSPIPDECTRASLESECFLEYTSFPAL